MIMYLYKHGEVVLKFIIKDDIWISRVLNRKVNREHYRRIVNVMVITAQLNLAF